MSGNSTFNIVYDCGSTSRTTIINKIHSLPNWFKNTHGSRVIDMLVISHFDDDHVNGLEELLRLYRVKKARFTLYGMDTKCT
ncbi:MBL fold metallo-hydrolase [Escherichia sp. E4385]|uniref:MBL fold metallo-hydrolase n=1 Tax=Escherichia sp. E4385 TaxID=2040639 RepID=UPI00107FA064